MIYRRQVMVSLIGWSAEVVRQNDVVLVLLWHDKYGMRQKSFATEREALNAVNGFLAKQREQLKLTRRVG
jgi:hypothetical protein